MRLAKTLLLALVAVMALGSISIASAYATEAPEVKVEEGGALPVTLTSEGSSKTLTELQNAAGVLKGEGLNLTATVTGPSNGTYTVTFFNVKKGTESCKSPTAANAGEVIVSDSFKLVFDSLTPLGAGVLFNVNEIEIICGSATKIHIKGNDLGLITPINTATTTFTGTLACSATTGEPAETQYWEAGVPKTALLQANFGSGFKKACENITGGVSLKASKLVKIVA